MDEGPGAILSFKTFLSFINRLLVTITGFPGGSEDKASAWNVGDPGSIPGSGRYSAEGNAAAAAAKSLQSCPTLCDPIPGILLARTLEWVAIPFSNA